MYTQDDLGNWSVEMPDGTKIIRPWKGGMEFHYPDGTGMRVQGPRGGRGTDVWNSHDWPKDDGY
jgi:hypothetical protein